MGHLSYCKRRFGMKLRDVKTTTLHEMNWKFVVFFNLSSVSHSVMSDSLRPHGLQPARLPCPSPTPRTYSNSYPLSQWYHPTILSSVVPFSSCLQSFQHQGLFKWISSSHQVAKVLEFQLQPQSFQWIFRTDFLQGRLVGSPCSPRNSQESSPTPQLKSINSLALSFLYSPTLTSVHDTGKTIALTRQTFVSKIMSLLFNMLSRWDITLLPRSKHLYFMVAVTICSDLGAQKTKVWRCFHGFPIYFPWSDGTWRHDLRFLNVEL